MSKKCPYCEKEYPEVSRFCPYCGTPNPDHQIVKKPEKTLDLRRQILLFAVGFIGFQIIGTLLQVIFIIQGRSIFGDNNTAIINYLDSAPISMFVNSISYCAIFCLLLFLAMPNLQTLLCSFKNKKAYIGALIAIAMMRGFNIIYSMILVLFGVNPDANINNNQTSLNSVIVIYPLISLIVFGLIGPVCEELTYRVGLFGALKRKNRILAYVLTIVIFTFIHFDFAASNIVVELINVPYYAAAAFAFTFVFDRYGFAAGLVAHIANNVLSVILTLI